MMKVSAFLTVGILAMASFGIVQCGEEDTKNLPTKNCPTDCQEVGKIIEELLEKVITLVVVLVKIALGVFGSVIKLPIQSIIQNCGDPMLAEVLHRRSFTTSG